VLDVEEGGGRGGWTWRRVVTWRVVDVDEEGGGCGEGWTWRRVDVEPGIKNAFRDYFSIVHC
jgi:hypothetical protein